MSMRRLWDFYLIDGIFECADSSSHVVRDDPVQGTDEQADDEDDEDDDHDKEDNDNDDDGSVDDKEWWHLRHEHIFPWQVFCFCPKFTHNPEN